MLIASTAAILMAANPAAGNVGYEFLVEGRNDAAVEEIQANEALAEDDPVKLINLGVAYARLGRTEDARALFEQALSAERVVLETAEGEWRDSRHLAWLAIAMLDRGDFGTTLMAAR